MLPLVLFFMTIGISYFGDMDKKWKEIVMKELGCSNYELYPSIDDCISKWKK